MSRFAEALAAADTPVIAEVKATTGTGADLLGGRSPADVVAAYHDAGVACLSVVTGRWFGGSPDLLRAVTAGTNLPVLQKDFVVRAAQVTAARELGASAVLLTAQLLTTGTLRHLVEHALALGLTPFVEVTTADEIAAVPHAADCVVAVNNKNIRTRERDGADLGRSLRLLPAVLASGTGLPVSASGVAGPGDGARLLAAGYRGLLVGTSLLRAADPRAWVAELSRLESGQEDRHAWTRR
ncbi:indole-3-glycerol-phosphate synthase [Actinophytocola sp. KF-1]